MLSRTNLNEAKSGFEKIFNQQFNSRRDRTKAFSDWLEFIACLAHQTAFQSGSKHTAEINDHYHRVDGVLSKLLGRYSKDQLHWFVELFNITGEVLSQRCYDFLGDIYQLLDLYSEAQGQFFTPFDVTQLCVRLAMRNITDLIEEKGIISICDDTCGSGGMLLSTAEYVADCGYDPRIHIQFEGTDLDRDCFNMAYAQLSMLQLQGLIRHGNTLTLKIYECRPTPQRMGFRQWIYERRTAHFEKAQQELSFQALLELTGVKMPTFAPAQPQLDKLKTPVLEIDVDYQTTPSIPEIDTDGIVFIKANATEAEIEASIQQQEKRQQQKQQTRTKEKGFTTVIEPETEATKTEPGTSLNSKPTAKFEMAVVPEPCEPKQPKKRTRIKLDPNVEQLSLFDI